MMAAKGKPRARGRKRQASGWRLTPLSATVAITALCLIIYAIPVFILFVIGVLPGLTAWLIDPKPDRALSGCVGSLNLAGVVPFLAILWDYGPSLAAMFNLLSQPLTWLAMYGAAAVGWGVYLGVPPLVASVRDYQAERRIAVLEDEQEKMLQEWGKNLA